MIRVLKLLTFWCRQTSAEASEVDRSCLVKLIVEDTLHAALALQHGAGPGGVGHLFRSLAVEVRVKAGGASADGGGKANPAGIPSHLKKKEM